MEKYNKISRHEYEWLSPYIDSERWIEHFKIIIQTTITQQHVKSEANEFRNDEGRQRNIGRLW